MDSIIKNPRPTRAECSDIANAILDGSDALMLSGETAKGDYPLDAVQYMAQICIEAEVTFNYKQHYRDMKEKIQNPSSGEAIAAATVQISKEINCRLIIVMTETGKTA
jgi:pyruvate kinase